MIRVCLWVAAMLICFTLMFANARLAIQRSSLATETRSLNKQRDECLRKISELGERRQQAAERTKALKAESKPIFSRLGIAMDLADVAGLIGEEIVSTAVFSRSDSYSVYFYVPAGGHKLAYCQSDKPPAKQNLRDTEFKTITLKGDTQYQIRFDQVGTDSQDLRFTLSGSDGTQTFGKLAFSASPSQTIVRGEVRCYPSQLSSNLTHNHQIGYDGAIRRLLKTGQTSFRVEIAVGEFTLSDSRKTKTFARFFIESDAPANLPAHAVGTWLQSAAMGRHGALSEVLADTFEPYDGSGRYYFKADFLEELQRLSMPTN